MKARSLSAESKRFFLRFFLRRPWRAQEETCVSWRRRRDSNPWNPCEFGGFQNRCLRPLGHSSGLVLAAAYDGFFLRASGRRRKRAPFRAQVPRFFVAVPPFGAAGHSLLFCLLPFLHSVQRFRLALDTTARSVVPAGGTVDTVGYTVDTTVHTLATEMDKLATASDKPLTAGHNGGTRAPSGDPRRRSLHLRRQNREARMTQRARKLVDALLEWRAHDRKSQTAAAQVLSVSRKTYALFEAGSWFPPAREQHFFAHTLGRLDPRLAEAFAHAAGTTGEALGLRRPTVVSLPSPSPAQARTAYDAAVYSAAEDAEVPAKTARVLVAAVIAKLRQAGVTIRQAEDLGRP